MSTRLWLILLLAWGLCAGTVQAQNCPECCCREELITATYSVADLVTPILDHVAKSPPCEECLGTRLVDMVRRVVEPRSWQHAGQISYNPLRKALVVKQTKAVHQELASLLASLRRSQDLEAVVELRIVELADAEVQRWVRRPAAERMLPLGGDDEIVWSPRETSTMLELMQSWKTTNICQAPRVTLFNGQEGNIVICDQIANDNNIVDPSGKRIQDCLINTGVEFRVQPVMSPDVSKMRLQTRLTTTWLDNRPDPKSKQRTHHQLRREFDGTIPDGQTLVMKLGEKSNWVESCDECCPEMAWLSALLAPRKLVKEHRHVYAMITTRHAWAEECAEAKSQRRHFSRVVAYPVADLVCRNWTQASQRRLHRGLSESTLRELVASSVRPESWDGAGGQGAMAYFPIGECLVVRQSVEVHRQIADLLQGLRRDEQPRIRLEYRLVRLNEEDVESIVASRKKSAVEPTDLAEAEEQDRIGQRTAPPTQAELRLHLAKNPHRDSDRTHVAIVRAGETSTWREGESILIPNGPAPMHVPVGVHVSAKPYSDSPGGPIQLQIEASRSTPCRRIVVNDSRSKEIMILDSRNCKTTVALSGAKPTTIDLGESKVELRETFEVPILAGVPFVDRVVRSVGYRRNVERTYVVVTPTVLRD